MENNKLNSADLFYYVSVRILLKKKMYLGEDKWLCTVNEEKKIVLKKEVEWVCETFDDAIKSFDPEEIERVTITYI